MNETCVHRSTHEKCREWIGQSILSAMASRSTASDFALDFALEIRISHGRLGGRSDFSYESMDEMVPGVPKSIDGVRGGLRPVDTERRSIPLLNEVDQVRILARAAHSLATRVETPHSWPAYHESHFRSADLI